MPGNLLFEFYSMEQATWDRAQRTIHHPTSTQISACQSVWAWHNGHVRLNLSTGDGTLSAKLGSPEVGGWMRIYGSYISGNGSFAFNLVSAAGVSCLGLRGSSLSYLRFSEGAAAILVAKDTNTWAVLDANTHVIEVPS